LSDGPRRLPDATALRDAIRSGAVTAEAVVAEHLARIRVWHPRINAAGRVLFRRRPSGGKKPSEIVGLWAQQAGTAVEQALEASTAIEGSQR